MKRIFVVAVVFFITACATVPPLQHDIQTRKTFDAEYVGIVKSVQEFFDIEDIPIKIFDNDLGIFETEEIRVPYEGFQYLSDYCDCGFLGGLYVYHDMLGLFNVFIKQTDGEKTTINIEAAYRASLWNYNTFLGWVECQSKGYIESKLFEYLDAAVENGRKIK